LTERGNTRQHLLTGVTGSRTDGQGPISTRITSPERRRSGRLVTLPLAVFLLPVLPLLLLARERLIRAHDGSPQTGPDQAGSNKCLSCNVVSASRPNRRMPVEG